MLREWLHHLAHRLAWQKGQVLMWWQGQNLWACFRCDTCGKTEGTTELDISFQQHPFEVGFPTKMVHRSCGRQFQDDCLNCGGTGVFAENGKIYGCACCGCPVREARS